MSSVDKPRDTIAKEATETKICHETFNIRMRLTHSIRIVQYSLLEMYLFKFSDVQ